ncbi:hypothetical protein B0I37DRAFT_375485 [Chaetomium sp. MPI-CAGE-AT-0009]|nr:hypothetical protein B0I37DRAFT_375485 [Chaetomium sp. MPI-CAGE-AT-0009]
MDSTKKPQRSSNTSGTGTNKPSVTNPTPVPAKRTTATSTTSAATTSNTSSTSGTTGTRTTASRALPVRPNPTPTTAANNAQSSGRGVGTRTAAGGQGPAKAQAAAAAANKNTNTTAASGAPSTATGTAAPKKAGARATADTLARECRIIELAVQRAVLATKTVLNSQSQFRKSGDGPMSQHQHAPAGKKTGAAAKNTTSLAKNDADKSPVTIADFAAQALIISAVHNALPDYGILGEENADELRKSGNSGLTDKVWELVKVTKLSDPECERLLGKPKSKEEMLQLIDLGANASSAEPGKKYIIMDPVDGTSAFMKGGQYAVATGVILDGQEIIGVTAGPNIHYEKVVKGGAKIREYDVDLGDLGTMISAVKGHGAYVRPVGEGDLRPGITLSRATQPPPDIGPKEAGPTRFSSLQFVDSEKSPKTLAEKVKLFAGPNYQHAIQLYSSHVRYMAMALGGRSYVQIRWPKGPKERWSVWDHVGTPLIYKESGPGVVTDMYGTPLKYNEGRDLTSHWGVITADAAVHQAIVDMVKQLLTNEKPVKANAKK